MPVSTYRRTLGPNRRHATALAAAAAEVGDTLRVVVTAVRFFVKAFREGDNPLVGVAGYHLVLVATAR